MCSQWEHVTGTARVCYIIKSLFQCWNRDFFWRINLGVFSSVISYNCTLFSSKLSCKWQSLVILFRNVRWTWDCIDVNLKGQYVSTVSFTLVKRVDHPPGSTVSKLPVSFFYGRPCKSLHWCLYFPCTIVKCCFHLAQAFPGKSAGVVTPFSCKRCRSNPGCG